MTSAVCTAKSATVRPSDRSGEAHLIVTVGHLDVTELHRVAPVVAQCVDGSGRVAHRAEAERTGPDAGPHDEADLDQREGADR